MGMTFGLQEHHIKKIESEIKRWDSMIQPEDSLKPGWIMFEKTFWQKLGEEFGWEPFGLSLYYFRYRDQKLKQ